MIMLFRLLRRKRAVSPIIAAILLIGLTIAAGAVVYFIVFPMLEGEGELIALDYEFEDTNNNDMADKLTMKLGNTGTEAVTIEKAEFQRNGILVSWTSQKGKIRIDGGKLGASAEFIADSESDEFGYGDTATLAWDHTGEPYSLEVKIPAIFSPFSMLYQEDFEGASPTGWVYYELGTHGSGPGNLLDWVITDDAGNHHWHCTNNHCQFIIQQSIGRDFWDVNITYDLRTNDNDANGIVFRFDDTGTYPKFYVIWWTGDHPGSGNPPQAGAGEVPNFNWSTSGDSLGDQKLTAHYVEETATGYTWYKIAETSWSRTNNVWYTWRVIADGSSYSVQIDGTSMLSFSDTRISHGYVGLVSMANANSHYDNIYIW